MSWNELAETQEKVVTILKNSIEKNRIAHAYVFEGQRGSGKKKVAYQLAKSYFCEQKHGLDPCQECVDCKRISSKNHPDVHVIEPEGQSIKKSQVELLQKEFSYRGMESKKKFYIIEHADKMTASAANSLLKFLEEPTAPTVAVLLTESLHQLLDTVLSRSQILSFTPLSPMDLYKRLVNDGVSSSVASLLSAITTDLNEAERFSENDWVVQARNLVIQLTEEIQNRPHQVLFTLQDKWLDLFKGKEQLDLGLDLLLLWYRDLLYTHINEDNDLVYIDQKERLVNDSLYSSQGRISRQMTAILEAKRHLSANVNPQLLMEKLLLRLQEG
ncbi:DNA polymerase III subunit delta' [Bacillus sp. FJAT-45350]|uniref:DNA polymerase III subunit delta' n=1 Tax=Bacillus sp. FJAT-45350 TaxID=2011014 RepID=UPI000BB9531A|nr:DNA polymerase III subunit delta' [Bacillus sp. FJAT-45350]